MSTLQNEPPKLFEPIKFTLTEILKSDGKITLKHSPTSMTDNPTNESESVSLIWYEKNSSHSLTKGLHNLGNTCYLNSVLQILTNTPIFPNKKEKEEHAPSEKHTCELIGPNKICFTCECLKLTKDLRSKTVAPNFIVDNLKHLNKRFSKNKQQDSHEFYLLLLNKLDKYLKKSFTGIVTSNVKCRSNHVSTTNEEFLNLTLEIAQIGNIQNALKRYFSESGIIKNYLCAPCNKKVDITKKYEWKTMPNYLVFHLNRFDRFANKIGTHIDFDLQLKVNGVDYILYGIVEHLGSSIDFGHYVAYVMNSDKIWHKVGLLDE